MKILHVDETFHPSFGYQSSPLSKFQSKLGDDIFIIAPDKNHLYPVYKSFGESGKNIDLEDKEFEKRNGVSIFRINVKRYIASRAVYDKKALNGAILKINPDVIMVHCVETFTAIYLLKRYKNKIPLMFDSHMVDIASKSKFAFLFGLYFRIFVTPIIKKYQFIVAKTQNNDYLNKILKIPNSLTPFISFGTDTDLFFPDEKVRQKFLKSNNLPENSFIVCSTGKLSPEKGGLFFAETVKNAFSEKRPIVFVVVANFEGEYEKKVLAKLKESENTILFFPVQKYIDLPFFYQISDACVFPKQCSMSFYDAQSCGLPTISEAIPINIERNSHNNGLCFKIGSISDFRRKISFLANMNDEDYGKMRIDCITFIENNYSYSKIVLDYNKFLKKAILNFNERKYKK